MKLCYRGVSYQSTPNLIKTVETETVVKFRGLAYRVRRLVNPSIQPQLDLVYRGVSYLSDKTNLSPSQPQQQPISGDTTPACNY
ncbi:DUF4278 domain-containing protein [Lyngbya aestuarii]|uniref:DUF4278 domain-containing protein n=1 Tax=Lyngbya aestuarii TaxID=118322 RepID=UPI00403DA954